MIKAVLCVAFFLVAAVSAQGPANCLMQFNQCRMSNVAQAPAACASQLKNCVMSSCSCLDMASGAVSACATNDTYSAARCVQNYQTHYASCMQTCATGNTPVDIAIPEIHRSRAQIVQFLGLPGKCSICKDIVGWVEGKGNAYACAALNLADLIPGCDLAGPLCGMVLDPVCSKILKYVESKTPISPSRVCGDVGMCGSNVVESHHHTASVVTLSKKGAAQFLKHHAKSRQPTTAQCYLQPGGAKRAQYVCMEQPMPVFYAADANAATSTASAQHKSSDMAVGVVIGVVAAVAAFGIVAAIVVIRRRRAQAQEISA